jgi:hypothetical protein
MTGEAERLNPDQPPTWAIGQASSHGPERCAFFEQGHQLP